MNLSEVDLVSGKHLLPGSFNSSGLTLKKTILLAYALKTTQLWGVSTLQS